MACLIQLGFGFGWGVFVFLFCFVLFLIANALGFTFFVICIKNKEAEFICTVLYPNETGRSATI